MRRWTGRLVLLDRYFIRPVVGDFACHLCPIERRGQRALDRISPEWTRTGIVWVCHRHGGMLWRRGMLIPEIVEAAEGDIVVGRCTGQQQDARRCGRMANGLYPAMPRCRAHEDQLPTRWDIEAEDEDPPVQTRWDDEDRAAAQRVATEAEMDAAAGARWDELRARGRVVVAEARARLEAQQGALALD